MTDTSLSMHELHTETDQYILSPPSMHMKERILQQMKQCNESLIQIY